MSVRNPLERMESAVRLGKEIDELFEARCAECGFEVSTGLAIGPLAFLELIEITGGGEP